MSATDKSPESNASVVQSESISRVAVKAAPFLKHNPAPWFLQLEAQLELSGITLDITKFYHVVAAIETDILTQVSDLVQNPPKEDRYNSLKDRLTRQFATSEEKRIRQLLSGIELADRHPSHLLRERRKFAANTVRDDFFKSLWLQRLPTHVQQILAASIEQLSQLALLANKILDVTDSSINIVSSDETIQRLERKLDNLSKQFVSLHRQIWQRSYSRSRHRNRSSNFTTKQLPST